jgi:hypothetical protein
MKPARLGAVFGRARRIVAAPLWLVVCAASVGCNQLYEPDLPPATNADELFSLDTFPYFYIELDDDAWEALEAEPKEYVSGTFRYLDEDYGKVGVRLKGNFTLTPLDEKPSFKIKFNEFTKGARFFGLKGLTLQNMHSDASMVKEYLAYRAFRELGVPAPRAGYARVYVNGEFYGVYLNLERYDDIFLDRVYDDPSGELYEGESGDDLDGDVWDFEQDEGDDESREALQHFADLATQDDDAVFFGPDSVLDTDSFLSYLAAETLTGQFDGYRSSHNYFIYHEPAVEEWTWLPWSLDQSFVREISPFTSDGFMARKCIDSDECRLQYVMRGLEAVDEFEDLNLEDDIDDVLYVIDYAAHQDDHKRFSNDSMESARDSVREYLAERPSEVRDDFDCLVDGAEPDRDGDGYGACYHDCDEDDEDVNPDAEEVCDGIDNDCSGFIDDVPECACPSKFLFGTEYFFCTHQIRWTDARDFCEEAGHQLARFDSRQQNEAVAAEAKTYASGYWSIGLNDRGEEQDYRWPDGSKPAFTNWASGEPAQALAWFDCVFMGGSGTWAERNCVEHEPFVCSALP